MMSRLSVCVMLTAAMAAGAQSLPKLAALRANDVVVFQGDSITDGGRARTGNDYNHTMGQDYAYIVSAEVGAAYPERSLTFLNRGISGDTIVRLAARWREDTLDLKPNLLSITVGVNDTFAAEPGETAERYLEVYDRLLAETIAALPGTKIVLGEPFLLPVGKFKDHYAADRAKLKQRQEAVRTLAKKYGLPLIPYQEIFDAARRKAPAEHWSWDGIHPTYAGHGLMAAEWMKAVDAAWKR
jgi:lysophospholipase L1-like esterase